ncbi:hypothetical protein [Oceaniradius stylonematis]|uniref:hypothetical protein n=1 Tax=Oceaniradius stylonematis TaxID=2184161 RepID=UPI0035CF2F42
MRASISIADSLDALARAETLGDGQARFAVSELDERLAAIDAQIRSANALAERSAEDVVRSVDDRMTEIARRIDQNEQAQQSVPSIAQLDRRLDQIAAMLASGSASAAPVDTTHLESQIADLSAALARGGSTSVDEERIWTAARTAAEEVASRMVAAGGENAMPETLEKLTGDLRTLESLARDTDSRNAETFEAIHDTLLQVVDHLASLEDKIRATPGSGAPSAPPPMPALFALRANVRSRRRRPTAHSFLKSVAGRLPLGRGRKEQTPGEHGRILFRRGRRASAGCR